MPVRCTTKPSSGVAVDAAFQYHSPPPPSPAVVKPRVDTRSPSILAVRTLRSAIESTASNDPGTGGRGCGIGATGGMSAQDWRFYADPFLLTPFEELL